MKGTDTLPALLFFFAATGCSYRYGGAYEVRGIPFTESELEVFSSEISAVIAPLGYTQMPSDVAWAINFQRRNSPQPPYAEIRGSNVHVLVAIVLPVFGDGIDIVVNDDENQRETPFVVETKRVIVDFLRERYGIEAPKFRHRVYMGSRTTDLPRQCTKARRAGSVLESASSERWFAARDRLYAGGGRDCERATAWQENEGHAMSNSMGVAGFGIAGLAKKTL